jgi:hypothetical protein
MRLRTATTFLTVAAALAALAAGASAATIGAYHQVRALVPMRIHEQIGFVPITGMDYLGTVKIRSGGYVYKGPFANVTASRLTTTQALKEVRRYGTSHGVYTDRRLTSAERRSFQLAVDLGRDADVLVVKTGHPACAGLTLAQVRSIAAGKTTRWSQVGLSPSGSDQIALRHVVVRGAFEPRFGVPKKPAAAKGASDGGLADAGKSEAVAAVTSWSRARNRGDVCAVPIDGVTPSNVSVHGLAYKGAYPIGFAVPRKRSRDPLPRTELALYLKFLKSERAAKMFRGLGLIMAKDDPGSPGSGPQGPGVPGGPSRDARGRAISPVRDDQGVTNALTGERIQLNSPPSYQRLAFEPGSLVRSIDSADGSTCSTQEGRWTVVEGWRYSENGGGVIARVLFEFGNPVESTIELPNDSPATAYFDGAVWDRSRDLAATC